jgi:integrase
MMALEWADVNFETGKLTIERSDWKGHVTTTKGGRVRHVGMTRRLAVALQRCRSLRSRRVLCQDDGEPLTQKMVQDHVRRAARRVLRHTFCSHLAIRGRPRARFRSSQVIRTSPRRSGTYT